MKATLEEIKSAAQAFKNRNPEYELSVSDDGKVRLMKGGSPSENDILLWSENGVLKCNNVDFGMIFSEYLHDAQDIQNALAEVRQERRSSAVVRREPPRQIASSMPIRDVQVQELTLQDIKDYICPDATEPEAVLFLKLCQARNLNPFLREAYLIKYGGKANMVVGKEAFTKKAEAHPQFDGFKAGIIVDAGGEITEREGTFVRPGETLLGGWAEVYRKDRKHSFKASVSLAEYDKKQGNWNVMKATMIRKVPLVQALREAFPGELGGMYDQAEIIEAEFVEAR